MPKRVAVGVVTTDKMDKTRRVEISRLEKHEKYGKFIRQKTVCIAHDENNETHVGDTVKIEECPPKSKRKRWNIVSVEQKSRLVDVNAVKAEAEAAKE